MNFQRFWVLPVLAASALLFSACNRDLSPLNTPSTSYAPPAAPVAGCPPPFDPTMYCDFETDPDASGDNLFWWGAGCTAFTASWSQSVSHSCYSSAKFVMGPDGGGCGHWYGVDFASPSRSFPPATAKFSMWYQITTNVTADLTIKEGTTSGDGESWTASITMVPGSGWTQVVAPLSGFVSGGGDGVLAVQDITEVWLYNTSTYPAHTLYIDDIQFTP